VHNFDTGPITYSVGCCFFLGEVSVYNTLISGLAAFRYCTGHKLLIQTKVCLSAMDTTQHAGDN
jgi:hypothetical protein